MKERKEPLRTCIGCGMNKPKKDLIRIVRTPEGEIIPDSGGKKSGRGAYVCRDPECIRKAWKTKSLDRSFREEISKDIYDRLAKEMDNLAEK